MLQVVPEVSDEIRGIARGDARVPLSVLDLATVSAGESATEALATTTELARKAEEWGYHRLWVAEHHGMPNVASSSPPVLLAHLAASTTSIRLGSGGVMLPNHAPLVVAEQFGLLHALHPGRVDLGLGRAPGTDEATAAALRRGDADRFPQEVAELTGFLDGSFEPGHRYERIRAVPRDPGGRPPIWLLGSSGFSARLAGLLGLPFAFAHHFSAANTEPALDLYRKSFRPSAALDRPYAMIGVSAVAADTGRDAYRLARTGGLSMLRLRRGTPAPVPTPEEAENHPYTAVEEEFLDAWLSNVVYGEPDAVRAGLAALLDRTAADELMITTGVYGGAHRIRSFRLIAEAHKMTD
ncbi:LLM class flavin-dependent oxidoreductase [Spongiactinospora sp. TRM90649]|uniref:LLM class flavin-dependent oxidoreductase n=1 Tax=Spongiactinospora sp. TRM90649 TaxID=3031114 RepID=UPI0023F95147|nr:LLM class flavin-dependent oxidoreductase [Spongiactinospora sp. TRM90649]MDF5755739.1 LLM class flavin-dependent oxidoreductase [Spongiactinospora sp. TRM90649]